jgi:hypothetical protein
MNLHKMTRAYVALAGSCDGFTGLMLMFAPSFTLELMGIGTLPLEPVYMQWIGAFVFSVGFSYFLPFLSANAEARDRRMLSILEITAFVRVVIATFTAVSVTRGRLDPAWISVTLTDAILAATQVTILMLRPFASRG